MIPTGCVEKCPGCRHRELSMQESLLRKSDFLRASLRRAFLPRELNFENFSPLRTVSDASRWNYRDRVCLHARFQGARWRFGLLRPAKQWRADPELVWAPDCPVVTPRVRELQRFFEVHLPPAEHFPLRYFEVVGDWVTLVLQEKKSEWERVTEHLQSLCGSLERLPIGGLALNFHPSAGNRVFSHQGWRVFWKRDSSAGSADLLRDRAGWYVGPGHFQQVAGDLFTEALDAAEAALISQGVAVVDLYCGSGKTLHRWLSRGCSVLGVELSGAALSAARKNLSSFEGSWTLLQGRVADRLPQMGEFLSAQGRFVVYVNPPRLGLEREFVDFLIHKNRAERIAYLSCSPGTLSRDLALLTQGGYALKEIRPYDFFPQTDHLETLVILEDARMAESGVGARVLGRSSRLTFRPDG